MCPATYGSVAQDNLVKTGLLIPQPVEVKNHWIIEDRPACPLPLPRLQNNLLVGGT